MNQQLPHGPVRELLIYLVDDDAPFRESLRLLLELRGYPVKDFRDGENLLENADFSRRACIVTDVNLPGISGLKILARVHGMRPGVPVVLVSGRATQQVRHEARLLGAAAFFDKPVPTADLFALLDELDVEDDGSSQANKVS